MADLDFKTLGAPDIRIVDLSLWLSRREFADASDYWDGNWLNATARFRTIGADVWVEGPFIRTDDIQKFMDQCSDVLRTLTGRAELAPLEPNLKVTLTPTRTGQIDIVVILTPDHMSQRHEFLDAIDQTFLPDIIASCKRVLDRFPIVGSPA